jgi:type IV secretory pathway VirB2 component (pilin)
MNKRVISLIGSVLLMQHMVFASDKFSKGLDSASNWLISTIGPTVIILGIVAAGYFIVIGNREGTSKAILAVLGGILIMSARAISTLITGWAG